jgi:hypothetical protein
LPRERPNNLDGEVDEVGANVTVTVVRLDGQEEEGQDSIDVRILREKLS